MYQILSLFFIKHQPIDRKKKTKKKKMNTGSIKSQKPLLNFNFNFYQLSETKITDIWEQ